jgi:rhodanese-related sulfurtransferase
MDALTAFDQLTELQVVDVRQKHEFDAGRIEGALHIPLMELPNRLAELDRNTPILTVCKTGSRSSRAAELLKAAGWETHDLDGGMRAWRRDGLPFSTPSGQPGTVFGDKPDAPPRTAEGAEPAARNSDPSYVSLTSNLIEVAYALQARFGDRDPDEQETREFMLEWLMGKGKTKEEAEAFLDS